MISNSYFLWDVPEPVHGSACGDNIAKFRALSAFEATPDFALLNATTYPPAGAYVGFLCKAAPRQWTLLSQSPGLSFSIWNAQICRNQRAESQSRGSFMPETPKS
jgi:hypothetical protein